MEEEIVKPTRMSRVARFEEEYEDEEKPTYLVKEDKEDNINFPLLIIGALFFIVAFVSMVVFFVYF